MTSENNVEPEVEQVEEVITEETADVEPDVDGDGEVTPLEAELAERTEDLQRLNAEYANYRRRTAQEREAVVEHTKGQVVAKLLPILDDLELAAQHGDLAEGPLKAFHDKFHTVLESMKVEAFGAEGDPFDAERHEAVQDLSTGDEKAIGTVLRKGYQLNGRLLRTAMVLIADPKVAETPAEDA
ncbi:molecular chaperone GrpE (heat shock protein) [Corynebacterium mustelae]|uniref:Protein GrpE n=1 Tax=Corynebacterium mustelae TaxID=571915 RepID=A0A0G3H0W5_9CORY|nr:nucleotide exchange factor GrpE [Corynebacterium mustelae]AKK07059.1 molecular chaperone GrpE (heat shock protein) [Corynebacterium mustelae]